MVKSFLKGFVLVDDADVANLALLIEPGDSVFDQFCQLNSAFHGVGDGFDHNGILRLILAGKKLVSSSEISANTYSSSDSNFVGG